ncbi:MAG: LysE family translocator [Rhodospirillales bacterium]|nr:LysE family translocator [Rhodospirillales bacterium]
MNWSLYGLFLITGVAAAAAPGPSIFFTVSQTLRWGTLSMLPMVAGLIGASVTYGLLVLIGVGALLAAYPFAFQVIRWTGAAYLLFLAYQQWRSAEVAASFDNGAALRRRTAIQAYLVGLANPGIVIFYLFFIPQFVDPALPIFRQLTVLVISQVMVKTTVVLLYVMFAGVIRAVLATERYVVAVNRGAAGFMAFAAIALIMTALQAAGR